MTADSILVLALLAPLVFVVVRQAVQRVFDGGLPTRLYLKHVYPRRTLAAHLTGDARSAERQIYESYLAQLASGSERDREIALQYLAQLAATQELADALIQALPLQNRRDLQMRMLRLLRDTLVDLANSHQPARPGFEDRLSTWSLAVSVWITEIALVAMGWTWLAQLSIGPFIVVSLIALAAALLPLARLVADRRSILRLAGLIVAVGLGLLWWFSEVTHSGVDSTPRRSMEVYGFRQVEVQIAYPRWLKSDNVGACVDKVTISVFGNNHLAADPIEISLHYDHADLSISNENCHTISPSFLIDTSNPVGEPTEFFVKLLRRESLTRESVTLTPQVRHPASGAQHLPAVDLAFTIQLEDPTWQTIRDLGKIGGATSVPAFFAIVLSWYRKKQ